MSTTLTLNRLLTISMSLLLVLFAAGSKAESRLIPGFLFVETAYLEQQGNDTNTADAYFTLTNLHAEDPLVLLAVSGENFESATFRGNENAVLDQIVIQPGERVAGIHLVMTGANLTDAGDAPLEFSVLIRRGLEPLPPVDAIAPSGGLFSGGIKAREAGIPNEDEYIFKVDIRS